MTEKRDGGIFEGAMRGLAEQQRTRRAQLETAPDGGWTIRVDPPLAKTWAPKRGPNPWRAHAFRGAERVEATGATEEEARAALRAKLGLTPAPPATDE